MTASDALLSLPRQIEPWLLICYVNALLVGARGVEFLARAHFERARRHAHAGFEYVEEEDHYRCPTGAKLSLHVLEPRSRLAVYRAPVHHCAGCHRKHECVPHGEARHIYHSLAAWAETDVGRFHQWLSVVLFAVAVAISAAGLVKWAGQAGMGAFAVMGVLSVTMLARDLRRLRGAVAA
ncbi:MAG TPA: hypothetical protein VGF55_06530 [Gemmataceae bacterium]|jgi:hypothetical protein